MGRGKKRDREGMREGFGRGMRSAMRTEELSWGGEWFGLGVRCVGVVLGTERARELVGSSKSTGLYSMGVNVLILEHLANMGLTIGLGRTTEWAV